MVRFDYNPLSLLHLKQRKSGEVRLRDFLNCSFMSTKIIKFIPELARVMMFKNLYNVGGTSTKLSIAITAIVGVTQMKKAPKTVRKNLMLFIVPLVMVLFCLSSAERE